MRASTPEQRNLREEDYHRRPEDFFQNSPDVDEDDPGPDVYEFIPEDEDHEGDATQLFEAARARFEVSSNVYFYT